MAVNLGKNKDAIVAAWNDVVHDKSKTDWALFGYEGQTNDLKVVAKGDGGIEEMREDLNSGKIMYAFCKVVDPKTSLNKFVLINWQGEGAPNLRKGTCANHIRDVANLLKGAHVTLNARTEEEVDYDLIIDKVSKSTGSSYSFKQRIETGKDTTSGPVGTTYQRVIPTKEINTTERDEFWKKEEEEEKRRQEEERRRKAEERLRMEEELRQREIEETTLREAKINERSASITMQREAEKNAIRTEDKVVEEEDDRELQESERRARSDILRKQRNQEAHELISKRTIDARAVFEQNMSAGQMHQRRASYNTNSHSGIVTNERRSTIGPVLGQTSHISVASQNVRSNDVELSANGISAASAATTDTVSQVEELLSEPEIVQTQVISPAKEEQVHNNSSIQLAQPYHMLIDPETELLAGGGDEDLGLRAEALYDYQAADDTEISFDPGDIITHIDQIDAGWWQGVAPDGNFGLFPANYVQLLE